MTTLSGKTALVTGASRGLGRASAFKLAQAGTQVLVHFQQRRRGSRAGRRGDSQGRRPRGRGRRRPRGGRRAHKLAKRTHEIIGDRLDIRIANAGVSKARRSRTPRSRIPTDCSRSTCEFPSSSSSTPADPARGQLHRHAVIARGPRRRGRLVCLFRDEGRNRHVGEAFRLRARHPRHFA